MKALSLSDVQRTGNNLPNRIILHSVEGFGKTSFGAQIPNVIFGQTRGETGLETLIDAGQLPETPHFPAAETWGDLLNIITFLTNEEHDFKAFALDVLNGAERLCHEAVCDREFGGEWGEKGFASYQKGYDVAVTDWLDFLARLDKLRAQRRMSILLLCHTKVTTFKNPEGADFDRYQPDMHHKTWAATHKWADAVLFGNFYTYVAGGSDGETKKAAKGKGKGTSDRLLYTQRTAAYDAKNRLGLEEEINLGTTPAEGWANFKAAIIAGRQQKEAA